MMNSDHMKGFREGDLVRLTGEIHGILNGIVLVRVQGSSSFWTPIQMDPAAMYMIERFEERPRRVVYTSSAPDLSPSAWGW